MLQVTTPIVSADWLYENYNQENVIVLDATIKKAGTLADNSNNEKQHLPNAVFFDLKRVFSVQEAKFPNTILPPNKFEEEAQKIGINNNSCIVVYDDTGIYSSPRVWWLFKTFGFHNIAVLNGGLPKWKASNYPLEKEHYKPSIKGDFKAKLQKDKVSYTQDVLKQLNSEVCILDARSSARFNALEQEPREEVRSGHIPSSDNLPYHLLLKDGMMKSSKELKEIYKTFNPNNNKIIFSCGSGITACILALGAEIIGFKNYAVYDGSWTEWGSTVSLPIKTTMKKDWTPNEFKAYILLYAAQSNFIQTKEEQDYILSKVEEKIYNAIHTEIVHDSDYERGKKIKDYLRFNNFTEESKKQLIKDLKEVFFADGSVDSLEKSVFKFINKILD